MVLDTRALSVGSKRDIGSFASDVDDQLYSMGNFVNPFPTADTMIGFQLQDLYDHFEIKLEDFEIKLLLPFRTLTILEKLDASVTLSSCIVPDESILKGVEVYISMSSFLAHFSLSIYGAILGLLSNFGVLSWTSDSAMLTTASSLNTQLTETQNTAVFCFSVIANLDSANFLVDFENDAENSCALMLSLHELEIQYTITGLPVWLICTKALSIITYQLKNKEEIHTLCSSEIAACSEQPSHGNVRISKENGSYDEKISNSSKCFWLHYQASRKLNLIHHKYTISLNNVELHCYPYIVALLIQFSENLFKCGASPAVKERPVENKNPISGLGFEFQRFGVSNFFETSNSEWESIPVDHFPFVTIYNTGSFLNLESSLIYAIPEWRKVLKLRDAKIGNPSFSFCKGSKQFNVPSQYPKFCTDISPTSRNIDDTDLFSGELILSSVRIHFHDSACIIGAITIPTSKSSYSIYEDSLDILSSTDGLTLSSSWWTQTLHEFLWGPSLPNLSPILNIRVRKQNNGSLRSQFEICFGIQHVTCILPPEYLAILIGYFSLPDWYPNVKQCPVAETSGRMGIESSNTIIYKFEILDSTLYTPVASIDNRYVKLDIQQLCCSFIENCDSNILLKDIPSECLIPTHKVAAKNHCLNVFGRDLSLAVLFQKDDESDSLMFNQRTGQRLITLISPISADVWIRIPFECELSFAGSSPTCVMAKVYDCQLNVEGVHVLVGYEALQDIIDQFSLVQNESQRFTSDVLQFIQMKRSLSENLVLPIESSRVILTETRCCVHSMSIQLYSSTTEPTGSTLVARAEIQFILHASVRNDESLYLDISFSSISVFSLVSSVMLVECTSACPSSVIEMNISMSDQGENEIHVSLPSLDIWLHFFDWTEIIDLISSYSLQVSETSSVIVSSKKLMNSPVSQTENETVDVTKILPQSLSMSGTFPSQTMNHDAVFILVKSENISVMIHIPVRVSGEAFSVFTDPQINTERLVTDLSSTCGGNQFSFVAFALESRCSELVSNGKMARLKCTIEKTNGSVELSKVMTRPLFQFLQINLEVEICSNKVDPGQVKAEVRCDSLEMWLSHHVFYLCRYMLFEIPEAGSSQFAFNDMQLTINLRKLSLLLTDGKRCSSGPLLEVLVRNSLLHAKFTENKIEGSVGGDLQVNYNNIHKVLWEPFVEPWRFQLSIYRRDEKSALLNSALMTEIHLTSMTQLNLNLTESLIEVVFRAINMIADAWGFMGLARLSESPDASKTQINENLYNGRYAPYIVQNLTSLPLAFHVCEGPISSDDLDTSTLKDEIFVQPGSSVPIYIDETPEEQLLRYGPTHSSERLSDKQFMDSTHRYIAVRLEGTSILSTPISMDLVGLSCFEVDFSKSSNSLEVDNIADAIKTDFEGKNKEPNKGFVVPVVVDVSVQRYTKLVRFYSTVVLVNATSMPFEVRFDIPFGVSPKILDPVYPGQELPLPLHLAEAGRMRWRPLGNAYLWSEAYNISNILAHENGIGVLRSLVCYPSHPSSDPFRFCLSVYDICLPAIGRQKVDGSLCSNNTVKQAVENSRQEMHNMEESKKHFIHLVTLSSPLVVNNYLPVAVTLTIESGGVTHTALLSEVEASFFHIDFSHDLTIVFTLHGFRPSTLKFPRAETFCTMAKFSGTKYSVSETVAFESVISEGTLYVTIEKIMDAVSGAREICISVPFLLYNCTDFSLIVSNCVGNMKGPGCTVPSCYNLEEQDMLQGRKDGLGLLSSNHEFYTPPLNINPRNSSLNNHIVSTRKNAESHSSFLYNPSNFSASSRTLFRSLDKSELNAQESLECNLTNRLDSTSLSNVKHLDFVGIDHKKVNGCMYSPVPNPSASEIMVQVCRCLSEGHTENLPNHIWSSPFFLVPSTGSTSVLVPHPSTNAANIVSVTSSTVGGPFAGRTRNIIFQPRYVISNACSKDLFYKQKGTNIVFRLRIGQNSHIHWADTERELLVTVRFDEPAWQWSGCFLPEHLGDTQLKMRNYVSGAVKMIRVEVQNADVSIRDEKIVGSSHGNSGTNLILLSDDDTGFMPYRVDNFSKERLRIYQQRCETFETIIHSYTSCPYAWDEPCYPHRLIVEVPGERVVGSYALDNVREYAPVCLPATSEKPERTLLSYVQAEGALKVLSIVDSGFHILNDVKGASVPGSKEKIKHDQEQQNIVHYMEKISFAIPFIGISLMNSYPQELLFVSAKNATIDLVRSMDQETYFLQLSSFQIDNQLRSTPYPVILSFEHENRSNLVGQMRSRDDKTKFKTESEVLNADSLCDPVFTLAAAKWRNTDASLVSFEYISLKVADFHLELEQEVILSLFEFFKTISSRFNSSILPDKDSVLPLSSDFGSVQVSSTYTWPYGLEKENGDRLHATDTPMLFDNHKSSTLFPSIVPIGAPWQQIYLLARKQKKIYIELFDAAPINLTLSFYSNPWMLRNGVLTSGESVIHRGLMALADVEGARIRLKQLVIAHQLASWESIQAILIRHYNRQLLHEIYKVFGSAGVIGNPMGFARSVGLGIKDFLSVPARSLMKNPAGLITGMAQGTTSLLSNTVYALSDAATQFSRAAHKGIVAFTFDDQAVAKMEKQQFGISSHSKGVINEFLEGLTGLLQSPIRGAEKHGLPGVISGIALGVTGLVARPAASILEVTGKTAQSIRNRSKLHHMGSHHFRVRLPRPLSRESPLRPYSWEEAVGVSVLSEADDDLKLKDEVLVMCKALKQGGKFVIITERLVLMVSCPSLVDLDKPKFLGIPADPEWVIEAEIGMDSVIHADADMEVVHIVGSSSDSLSRQNHHQQKKSGGMKGKGWNNSPTPIPLLQTNLEFKCKEEAENFLQVLLSTIEKGKERGWGYMYLLHQSNLK